MLTLLSTGWLATILLYYTEFHYTFCRMIVTATPKLFHTPTRLKDRCAEEYSAMNIQYHLHSHKHLFVNTTVQPPTEQHVVCT
jgi:hypothetical protein